mgnify:CR=1 FL=1
MDCPECNGRGHIVAESLVGGTGANGPWQGYRAVVVMCPECFGSGVVEDEERDDG